MPANTKADNRERPSCTATDAAHYLNLPLSTVRAWCFGQAKFQPVIKPVDPERRYLSFTNLVEIHVLAAIRRHHQVALPKVRAAIEFTQQQLGVQRPLVDQQFETDGVDLFVQKLGALINVSKRGQTAMRELIGLYLTRIERDPSGLPIRLFPFTRAGAEANAPRAIVIDPAIAFGRPIIARKGIPTDVLAASYKAGDDIDTLAAEYGLARADVEEAIRCELEFAKAA